MRRTPLTEPQICSATWLMRWPGATSHRVICVHNGRIYCGIGALVRAVRLGRDPDDQAGYGSKRCHSIEPGRMRTRS